MKVKVIVRTKINPTEDESKVLKAVMNLTNSDKYIKEKEGIFEYIIQEGDISLLNKLREILRRDKILDASRKIIMSGLEGSSITFHINKQVAYMGKVSFCKPERESPLGPISFYIWTDDPKSLIDWLATKTIGGIPVDELCHLESQHYVQSVKPLKK